MKYPLLALVFAVASAAAQPAAGSFNEFKAEYSYSPRADLERNGKVGDAQINRAEFAYTTGAAIAEGRRVFGGVFASDTELNVNGSAPLPARLRLAGLTLGVRADLAGWLGQGWSGTVMARPNWTWDSASWSGAGFNVPVGVSVGKHAAGAFGWDVGLAVNPRGEYPVLPLLGVQWDFAPKWTASLGFPRTGLLYKASPEVQVRFGADYQGGTYHVNQARAPRLGDTWLDYRDFRLGAGVDLRVSEHVSVALDGGAVVRRRFDYFDRDYRVDGSATTYVTIGLRGRF